MKILKGYIDAIIFSAFLPFAIICCNNNAASKREHASPANTAAAAKTFIKPPSSFQDTLLIDYPSAVFYQPDSVQLIKIKAVAGSMFYESTIHEYFYQMLTARKVIKLNWPALKILEADKYRFLLFIKKDKTSECINLDKKTDTHGLFVFDGKKPPVLVDMTNTETDISFYLKE